MENDFYVHIPPLTPAQRTSFIASNASTSTPSRDDLPANAVASGSRLRSSTPEAASSPFEVTRQVQLEEMVLSSSDEEVEVVEQPPSSDNEEEEAGVYRILFQRDTQEVEEQYICQLAPGGKKVRRTRTELETTAPRLFEAWKAAQNPRSSPPPSTPPAITERSPSLTLQSSPFQPIRPIKQVQGFEDWSDSDDEVVVMTTSRNGRPLPVRLPPQVAENELGDSSSEKQDSAAYSDSIQEAGSGSSEEEQDELEDDDEDFGYKAKPRTRATRSPVKSSRLSRAAARPIKKKSLEYDTFEESSSSSESELETRRLRKRAVSVETGESSDDLQLRAVEKVRKEPEREVLVLDSDESEGEGEDELEDDLKVERGPTRFQDEHYRNCAKCNRRPTNEVVKKFNKARDHRDKHRTKRRKNDETLDTDEEEQNIKKLGAWIGCAVCVSTYHFDCMPGDVKKELIKKLEGDHIAAYPLPPPDATKDDPPSTRPRRRKIETERLGSLKIDLCPNCKRKGGSRCYACGVSGVKPIVVDPKAMVVDGEKVIVEKPALMFRCKKCKRPAHYDCLPHEGDITPTPEAHAESYFVDEICDECSTWTQPLDIIIAWVEGDGSLASSGDTTDAVVVQVLDERTGKRYTMPSSKDPECNAKYLVKWQGESYRRLEWVSHSFLVATAPAKLGNFLTKGSTVAFDAPVGDLDEDDEDDEDDKVEVTEAPRPDPTAVERIPKAWSTPDRVLDVFYKSRSEGGTSIAFDEFRKRGKLPEDPKESILLVEECYFKWGDLPYSASTTEAPPAPDEQGYDEYVAAYNAFLVASNSKMRVPTLKAADMAELDRPRDPAKFKALVEQPPTITGGKLMPFQLEGVNFLLYRWWLKKGSILADEMGLGKTVQIITLLSVLSARGSRPFLISVPNSTIGNWMREFARWAPALRVVPYSGDANSRQIVEDYELFENGRVLKAHVVLATYEAIANNISVFRKVARWDCLVVDEGQRLKGGRLSASKEFPGKSLYEALQTLNVSHRILLTGTPLNNTIVELFNLLRFIDPKNSELGDTTSVTEEYLVLDAPKIEKIRTILKPYLLRRTKDMVLDLPPLNEVVVPVSMSLLQRELYRSILARNAAALAALGDQKATGKKVAKANFNNITMELRKLLNHPYLISPGIERQGVTVAQAHANLTEASAKLVLLSHLLVKLKAMGHRVLIFSQFKIALNIIEEFLGGLKDMKYLRLDGDTAQMDRQRGIDAFNAEDSPFFIYLLSTRAGGVGINLTTADTVIMFDQDFNPHQDLQAIARAHRIGQKKPVSVFKLIVKGTIEERYFMLGNKKLGLDHLIIQRLDAVAQDESDMQTLIQFSAKAIFDDKEMEANAIRYTEADITDLIERSFAPPAMTDAPKAAGASAIFAEAKIWEVPRGEDGVRVADEVEVEEDLHDFWANILKGQEETERKKKEKDDAAVGRGKRARAIVAYGEARPKAGANIPSPPGSDTDFVEPIDEDSGDDEYVATVDGDDLDLSNAVAGPSTSTGAKPASTAAKAPRPKAAAPAVIRNGGPVATPSIYNSTAELAVRRKNIEVLIGWAQELKTADVEAMLRIALTVDRAKQTEIVLRATTWIKHLAQLQHAAAQAHPAAPAYPPPHPYPAPK